MTDTVVNSKIERVVESVEDFFNAVIDGRLVDTNAPQSDIDVVTGTIYAARKDLATALREFLQPRLNIIQGVKQDGELGGNVTCPVCQGTQKCDDANCYHWHAAIAEHNKPKPEENRIIPFRSKNLLPPPDDEPPRRA